MADISDKEQESVLEETIDKEFLVRAFHRGRRARIADFWITGSVGALSFASAFVFLYGDVFNLANLICSFMCFFVAYVAFLNTEAGGLWFRRASHPIVITGQGIEMFSSRREKRKGFTGFIRASNIDWVHIRENEIVYPEWFQKWFFIDLQYEDVHKASNGVTELLIHTKDGHLYRSGPKPKETTMAISAELLRRWHIIEI